MRTFLLAVFVLFHFQNHAQIESAKNSLWTFTYLKASDGHRADLKLFLKKNWLAMDKIATEQGLFKQYHLLENNDASLGWDFTVVVQYKDEKGYEGVKTEFEKIRQAHQRVLVNGKVMAELGKIVKSEEFLEATN
jgi:hypothetical protein